MAEIEKNPEIPQEFVAGNFITDVIHLSKQPVNLEDYIHTYLDYTNDEGEQNILKVQALFKEVQKKINGEPTSVDVKPFFKQLLHVDGAQSYLVPSPNHQAALERSWEGFKELFSPHVNYTAHTLWEDLGPVMEELDFSKESYVKLMDIEEKKVDAEPPAAEEPPAGEPKTETGPGPVPQPEQDDDEPSQDVSGEDELSPEGGATDGDVDSDGDATGSVDGPHSEEGNIGPYLDPDSPSADSEGEPDPAGEEPPAVEEPPAGGTPPTGEEPPAGGEPPAGETPPAGEEPPAGEKPGPKKDPESDDEAGLGEPEAERVPFTIDAFTEGMNQVMNVPAENRQAAFLELMGMVSPENFAQLFELLNFPIDQIELSRSSGSLEMKQRVLGILGFKKAPSFEVFQKRFAAVVDLIAAVSGEIKSNKTLELYAKALTPVLIITVDSERLGQALSGVNSLEQLKTLYSSSGPEQYNDYFHGISEESSEKERRTSLKSGIKEVMNGSVWKQRKAMLALLKGVTGVELEGTLSELLKDPFSTKTARKTPGSNELQEQIYTILGLDSGANPNTILKRLRDVDYVIQNVLRKDEVYSGRRLRMALHRAMLCVVPEDMVEGLEKNPPASSFMDDQQRNLRFVNGLPWRDQSQCEAFFSMGEEDDEDPEAKAAREASMGTFARAKEFFTSKDNEGLLVKAGRGYAALALAEWGVRSGLTVMKSGWEFTKRGARTAVNVMTKPFVQAGERFGQGWNYVEAPTRVTLPDDSPWYQRLGNSTWFSTKRLAKGTAAFALGLTLGTAGVAEGAVYTLPEAIGIQLSEKTSPDPPKKEDIMSAIEGKVSDETKKEIEEAGEVGAMVEMAAAALGENGIQILKDAGVIVDEGSGSFASRISMDRQSGMLAMGAAAFGGAKEMAVDNTIKSVKLEGTREVAVRAGKVVLGGGFNIPTANELLAFAGDVKEVAPGFQAALESADKSKSTFEKYLYALANLPKDQQLKVTRGFVNTFDLDEGDSKWRKGLWTVMPEALDMYSNLKYKDRNYKPNYERGVGVSIAGLAPEKLGTFMGDSESIEKLFENHELIMSTSADYYRGLINPVSDKESKVGRQHQLRAVASALQKFLGVKKIRAASSSRYEGRIAPAITNLGNLRTKLAGEDKDKNKAAIEDVDFMIALYKKLNEEVFGKKKLMALLEDPTKVEIA